jgi:hypothetical protein
LIRLSDWRMASVEPVYQRGPRRCCAYWGEDIAAFPAGANHELGRELMWREFPTRVGCLRSATALGTRTCTTH